MLTYFFCIILFLWPNYVILEFEDKNIALKRQQHWKNEQSRSIQRSNDVRRSSEHIQKLNFWICSLWKTFLDMLTFILGPMPKVISRLLLYLWLCRRFRPFWIKKIGYNFFSKINRNTHVCCRSRVYHFHRRRKWDTRW